ncbi:MAG: DUF1499 domain-containing protein [Deltaproteobacteria bacterium]|nr:DUF1499 domain-containing protein [Deltaproteobacteria bacterium]
MIVAWLSLFDGVLAVALMVVGVGGAHFGLVAAMAGFRLFQLGFWIGTFGFFAGLLALGATWHASNRGALVRALWGLLLSAAMALPAGLVIFRALSAHYPLINDIVTDPRHPLEFAAVGGLSPAGAAKPYPAGFAALQRSAYGELSALKLALAPQPAFRQVQALARSTPGWQVTRVDEKTLTLQGVAASRVFRFRDDFVIQVRPNPGGGALVEMRSRSRDGRGDFSVNYRRIAAFFDRLRSLPQR